MTSLLNAGLVAVALAACGPRAAIPILPTTVPSAVPRTDSLALLATALAPVLYLQPDETFPLSRAVAVVQPDSQVVAYHLLWRDDAYGAWIPGTVPTDEEIVWVGYDSTATPTRIWTYWHGTILTTPWERRQVAIDVQWGKHGSLPRGADWSDLPRLKSMSLFYLATWAGIPDLLLGRTERAGPICFCHGRGRYGTFSQAFPLALSLDAVVVARDPRPALHAIFGASYSEKPAWPWSD